MKTLLRKSKKKILKVKAKMVGKIKMKM